MAEGNKAPRPVKNDGDGWDKLSKRQRDEEKVGKTLPNDSKRRWQDDGY